MGIGANQRTSYKIQDITRRAVEDGGFWVNFEVWCARGMLACQWDDCTEIVFGDLLVVLSVKMFNRTLAQTLYLPSPVVGLPQ